MEYTVSDLEIIRTNLEVINSSLSTQFFYSKKYKLRNKDQVYSQLVIADAMLVVLNRIIEFNYNCYPMCSISTFEIESSENGDGIRTEKLIGKAGGKVRIKSCDVFSELEEQPDCVIFYRDYNADPSGCVCCNFEDLIRSITTFINTTDC